MKLKQIHVIGIVILVLASIIFVINFFPSRKITPVSEIIIPVVSTSTVPVNSTSTVTTITATTTTTTITKTISTTTKPTVVTPKPVIIPPTQPIVVVPTPAAPQPILVQPTASSSANLFIIKPIPLLSGGTASAGVSLPVAYLQVINSGNTPITLKEFRLQQNGSASAESVVGFIVIDEKNNRVSASDNNVTELFPSGTALIPINVVFAPHEMKLFTIKVVISNNISMNLGRDLKIDVASATVEGDIEIAARFPIRGTTWVINQ